MQATPSVRRCSDVRTIIWRPKLKQTNYKATGLHSSLAIIIRDILETTTEPDLLRIYETMNHSYLGDQN